MSSYSLTFYTKASDYVDYYYPYDEIDAGILYLEDIYPTGPIISPDTPLGAAIFPNATTNEYYNSGISGIINYVLAPEGVAKSGMIKIVSTYAQDHINIAYSKAMLGDPPAFVLVYHVEHNSIAKSKVTVNASPYYRVACSGTIKCTTDITCEIDPAAYHTDLNLKCGPTYQQFDKVIS